MIRNKDASAAYTLVMLTGAEKRHVIACYQCKVAGRETVRRCDCGRQLARKIARIRARQQEAVEQEKRDHHQEQLW